MIDNKSRFHVNAILSGVHDQDDRCMTRFIDLVSAKRGVDKLHVVEIEAKSSDDTEPANFCIHFDPDAISVSEVRQFAHQVGAELDQRYGHWHQRIDPMHARRASAIESRLARIDGVIESVVSPDGAVRVEFDRQITDARTIEKALDDQSSSDLQERYALLLSLFSIGHALEGYAVELEVGPDEVRSDMMPDDKVNEIQELPREGGVVLESADVALMVDNLDHWPLD